MHAPCEATLLRIFLGNDDVYDDKPLYDEIVIRARTLGMAGATVTRGLLAYGPATIGSKTLLKLSEDLPVLIEIIDTEEKIQAFLPQVEPILDSGVITLQTILVRRYGRAS